MRIRKNAETGAYYLDSNVIQKKCTQTNVILSGESFYLNRGSEKVN